MGFLDSLDIANRACQHCGVARIQSITEDSNQNNEIAFAYDKLRRAELRRNTWTFACKRVALRPVTETTLLLAPADWDETIVYLPGAIVKDDNGFLWSSSTTENLNNTPGSSPAWDAYFGPMTADVWDTDTAYFAGELAYVATGNPGGYVVFVSLENDNEDTPTTATAYDATVTYKIDDVVSSGGFQFRSLIAVNMGITPANGPALYDSGTTYALSQQVTASDGYIYTSTGNGNLGNDPVGDAGVHWTNTTVPNAWSKTPTLFASSKKWLPLFAALTNLQFIYPIGTGPAAQLGTRNVYRLPSGFLREAPQDPKAGSMSFLGAPSGLAYNDWVYDGNFIVTSETDPIIFRFVADVTTVTAMDDMFCEGFAARIAFEVCERLTQSTAKLQNIGAAYKTFMGEARTVNAIEQGPTEPPEDDFISCRR